MSETSHARGSPAQLILIFVAACALEKLFAIFATGFNDDEAYTLVIARQLAQSYFDHPPLHQWVLHGFVALFGEGRWARLPFFAMQVATNLPLHAMTRRLFGREAALWAIFAFNATAYFLVLPDGFIMPDAPLLLCLATAGWAISEILFASPGEAGNAGALWLAAGLALGLAGLAKYSAVFAPLGLFGFFALSPRHRHWLADARPYLGAALGLAVFSPALIWNYENHWVSFAFQSDRAAGGVRFDARAWSAVASALGAQIAALTPWIGAPLVAGLVRSARGDADSSERYLLWLAAPQLLLFTLLPLVGQRAIPHWFNSGWLFVFPLAGQWLAACDPRTLRLWSRASAALAALTVALYLPATIFGLGPLLALGPTDARDPTRYSYDWNNLGQAPAWAGAERPDFAVVDNWRVGGRVGVALGPGVPICAFTTDPRGFAFECDQAKLVGRDALIVLPQASAGAQLPVIGAYFQNLGPSEDFAVGRSGRAERWLTLTRAQGLARPYPLPYGPAR